MLKVIGGVGEPVIFLERPSSILIYTNQSFPSQKFNVGSSSVCPLE